MKNKILISIVLLLISVSTVLADDYTKMAEDFKKSLPDTMEFVCINNHYIYCKNKSCKILFRYDLLTKETKTIKSRKAYDIYVVKERVAFLKKHKTKKVYTGIVFYNLQSNEYESEMNNVLIVVDEKEKLIKNFSRAGHYYHLDVYNYGEGETPFYGYNYDRYSKDPLLCDLFFPHVENYFVNTEEVVQFFERDIYHSDYHSMAKDFEKLLPDTMEFVIGQVDSTDINDHYVYCKNKSDNTLFCYDLLMQETKVIKPKMKNDYGFDIYAGKERIAFLKKHKTKNCYTGMVFYNLRYHRFEYEEDNVMLVVDEKEKIIKWIHEAWGERFHLEAYDYDRGNVHLPNNRQTRQEASDLYLKYFHSGFDKEFHWLDDFEGDWLKKKSRSYPVKEDYYYSEFCPQYRFSSESCEGMSGAIRVVKDTLNNVLAVGDIYSNVFHDFGEFDFFLIKYDFEHNAYNIQSENASLRNCIAFLIKERGRTYKAKGKFPDSIINRAEDYVSQLKSDNEVYSDNFNVTRIDGLNFIMQNNQGLKIKQTFFYDKVGKKINRRLTILSK